MASKDAPKVILLKGDPAYNEGVANAAITPGHLIEIMTTGKLRVHATAAGMALPMFALSESYAGGGIDDAYASNDQVCYAQCKSGDEIYGWLKNGVTSTVGAFLESDGAGGFQLSTHAVTNATTAAAWPVAIALEAVNNSGGGTGPNSAARIKVRVL